MKFLFQVGAGTWLFKSGQLDRQGGISFHMRRKSVGCWEVESRKLSQA